jgi:hypothetical protein
MTYIEEDCGDGLFDCTSCSSHADASLRLPTSRLGLKSSAEARMQVAYSRKRSRYVEHSQVMTGSSMVVCIVKTHCSLMRSNQTSSPRMTAFVERIKMTKK